MLGIKYKKEPGYLYDLIFIFILFFNKELVSEKSITGDKADKEKKFFQGVIDKFGPVPEELLLFFYLKNNGRSYFVKYYFDRYEEEMTDKYDFEFLKSELLDYQQIIDNVLDFYLPDYKSENKSIEAIASYIDNSKYDELIKRLLYSFFVNPNLYIQKLVYQLMEKEVLLSKYYNENYDLIFKIQNQVTFNSLKTDLQQFRDISFLENKDEVFMSVCLLNKNCINMFFPENKEIFLLGYDYLQYKDFLCSNKQSPALKVFGDILTEQNRIDILDLLLERKELTIKDLERLLNFSGSTSYYHLTMMTRYEMVKTRNQGRTVLYSINQKYFDSVIQNLSKYSTNGGEQ